jgi:thiol-disulfide isomerase/thioredoxin
MKKSIVFTWLAFLLSGIIALFWYNEWIYSLPTPVPVNYHAVNQGQHIDLPFKLKTDTNKPVLLHFFNPACPCSRFNMPHFKSLVSQYGSSVSFAIVVMSNKKYTEKDIQQKFDLDIPVLSDTSLAASCGVYSTPQAVIIDANRRLFYRGNYNTSRYCTDKKSEFARIALDELLHGDLNVTFDSLAVKAYGCELPVCTKQ